MKTRFIIVIVFVATYLLPLASNACPLCQAGATKRTTKAYEETTALLALLPILGGGGIIYWLYNKGKNKN